VTPLLWHRTTPGRCACGGSYRPHLSPTGKLIKTREPAWRMMEQTRDPACLQERCRALAAVYQLGYQHHRNSRGSGGGYPDVHLWAPLRGSVWVELKRMRSSDRDDPSPAQVTVMGQLQDAGHLVYLARPCCLFTGAVDEVMADLAGTPCPKWARHRRTCAPATPEPVSAAAPPRTVRPAAALPGGDPVLFEPAVGYLVPMPDGDAAHRAVVVLEDWLRAAGFPATDVPFPIRVVAGDDNMSVQVRVHPGNGERVWRGGVPARPFPDYLVSALDARVYAGPDSGKATELLGAAPQPH
jgi:hypothetical protein